MPAVRNPAVPNPPAAGPPHEGAEAPIPIAWQHALAAWLAAHKTYPDAARRAGDEGVVVLRFTADRSGHVLDAVLMRGSGSPALDAAAEAMVRGADLPPFAAGMAQNTVTVTMQIRYALSQ
jgi:periplasmic protein TonB